MTKLTEIFARFNSPVYAAFREKIDTAIRNAYDLGKAEAQTRRKDSEEDLIEHMLTEVEEDLNQKGKDNDFILSLRKQFDVHKNLSPKQVDALRKFYENVT